MRIWGGDDLTDNLCSIYESRPDICNVEKMYDFFKAQMSEEEYCQLMTESCKALKKSYNQ